MKIVRRAGVVLAAAALSIGLLGSPATAGADTSWGGAGIVKTR
jgi:hypothetical protein